MVALKRAWAVAAVLAGGVACEDVLGIDTGRVLVEGGAKTCSGTIGIRILYDMTGPTKDVSTDNGVGVRDLLREIDSGGGVRGCALDLDAEDSKYDAQTSLAVYDAWKARPDWAQVSTIVANGTPMVQVLGPRAAADGKLLVSAAYAGELASPDPVSHAIQVPSLNDAFAAALVPVTKQSPGYPYVFFQPTDYTTSARIAMNYVWRQASQRVGFFYCSTSAFCTDPVDGAKTFLQQLGGTQIGRDLAIELTDTDAQVAQKVLAFFQAEVAHKAANPTYAIVDWVWFGNTRASLASLGKALASMTAQLGLHVSVITNTYGLDEALYAACGNPCVGFFGVQPLPVYGDSSVTGMADLLRVHQKYRMIDGEDPSRHATVEYVGGYLAADAWRLAAEQIVDAGLPVTGANLRDAMNRFQNVSVDGFATLSYSPGDHRPQGTARIYRLSTSGTLETVGQPIGITLQPDWIGW
jgi:hypothetical protein